MRKTIYYSLLLALLGAGLNGCTSDTVSSPPQPSFTVDKTSGFVGATEFTFSIKLVDADAISLFPYGTDDKTKGGIVLDPATDFTNGTATVKFSYAFVGTFSAVVVANKHNATGSSVKNVTSAAQSITVTNNLSGMSAFSVTDNTTDSKNPATFTGTFTGNNIAVTLPYANHNALSQLVASFTVDAYSTVTVGSAAQTSGTTVNNFSSVVNYTVKSQDGTSSTVYPVTVTVTPAETDATIKSAGGTNVSASFKKKALPAAVDNAAKTIVIYDVYGTTDFDSVRVSYTLNGSFASASMKNDTLLNLNTSKSIVVTAQNGTTATYKIYAVAAPNLTLSFPALNPVVNATTTNFAISADVLNGTTVSGIVTNSVVTLPTGVTATMTAGGNLFVSGGSVDYTSSVPFVLSVTDANLTISYLITFNATVNVVK